MDLRYTRARFLNNKRLLKEALQTTIGFHQTAAEADIRYIGSLYFRIYTFYDNMTVFYSTRHWAALYSEQTIDNQTIQKTSTWTKLFYTL